MKHAINMLWAAPGSSSGLCARQQQNSAGDLLSVALSSLQTISTSRSLSVFWKTQQDLQLLCKKHGTLSFKETQWEKGNKQQLLSPWLPLQKEGIKIPLPLPIPLGNPSWISKSLSSGTPRITLIINFPGISAGPLGGSCTWDPAGPFLPRLMLICSVVSLFAFELFYQDGLSD